MDFADKVKLIRSNLGLTQMELAKELNISFATVNRWENETFKPSVMAQKIVDDYCKQKGIVFRN